MDKMDKIFTSKPSTILTYLGYGISKENLSEKQLDFIRKISTLSPSNFMKDKMLGFSQQTQYKFFKESKTRIYIPKHIGLKHFGSPDSTHWISTYKPEPNAWDFSGKLRPTQEEIINIYLESIKKGNDGVVALHCGGGKTVTSLNIASRLKKKTLVIVNEEDLGEQWTERIKDFFPNVKVGWIQRERCEIEGSDIVIGMLQSLAKGSYDPKLLAQFGLVIVDECHIIGSEVYTKCLIGLCAENMLGLSATPRRKDGLTDAINMFLGPIIYHKEHPPDEGVQVMIKEYADKDPRYSTIQYTDSGMVSHSTMLTQIATWAPRSEFIIEIVINLLKDPYRQILLISDRRETHLEYFAKRFEELKIDFGFYVGRGGLNKKEHRERVVESTKSRVILATYMKAKQGMDIKTLNTLIMATPQPDIEQTTGRILRELPEDRKVNPLIVDIVDVLIPSYKRQLTKRKKYYKEKGYKIIGELDLESDSEPEVEIDCVL
jgi:superfamily II DNA or RNA helicase